MADLRVALEGKILGGKDLWRQACRTPADDGVREDGQSYCLDNWAYEAESRRRDLVYNVAVSCHRGDTVFVPKLDSPLEDDVASFTLGQLSFSSFRRTQVPISTTRVIGTPPAGLKPLTSEWNMGILITTSLWVPTPRRIGLFFFYLRSQSQSIYLYSLI